MLVGMVIGGLLLSSICYGLAQLIGALNVIEWRREIAIFVALVLISGDIVAIYNDALYPLSFSRQTRRTLQVAFSNRWVTPFIWGVDAGFSFFTYRVTSGLWICISAVVLGIAAPWYLLIYAAAFATAFWLWAVIGSVQIRSFDFDSDRVRLLVKHRIRIQICYTTVVIAGVILTMVTSHPVL